MIYIENKPSIITAYKYLGTDKIDDDMKIFLQNFKRHYYFKDGNMYIKNANKKQRDEIVNVNDYIVLLNGELRLMPEDIFTTKYKKYEITKEYSC